MTILLPEDAQEQVAAMAEQARAWVASPEGRKALAGGAEQARRFSEEWREAQKVDRKTLDRPVTI